MAEWIDRQAALAALGVRAQTLYAYASRGRIERCADPADPRRSLYRADDIEALRRRRDRGRQPRQIAASAIAWGEPSMATAISTVIHGRLIYRGIDGVALADHAGFEETAALLWEQAAPPDFTSLAGGGGDDPFAALAARIPAAAPAIGRSGDRLCLDAAGVIASLAASLGAVPPAGAMHERIGARWSLDRRGTDLVRRSLVLLADHELNPSTFAARVAASTGASIAACLMAALATLSGPRHGGAGRALAGLVDEAARDGAAAAISRWLAQGAALPGFGHPLYPAGDPRARAILAQLTIDPLLAALAGAVEEMTGALPNVDFALAAMTRHLSLPADAPFRLFAIARSTGWAAHAIEQARSGQLIRPRGVYTGTRA